MKIANVTVFESGRYSTHRLCERSETTYETNPGRGSNWIPFGDKTEHGSHRIGTAGILAPLCTDEVSIVYCAY